MLIPYERRVTCCAFEAFFRLRGPREEIPFMNECPWRTLMSYCRACMFLLDSDAAPVGCDKSSIPTRRVKHSVLRRLYCPTDQRPNSIGRCEVSSCTFLKISCHGSEVMISMVGIVAPSGVDCQ